MSVRSSSWATRTQRPSRRPRGFHRPRACLSQYGVASNSATNNLLAFWPSRGRTGAATSPNFFGSDNSDNFSDNGIAKIDYVINSKNNLAFRYFGGTGTQTAPVGSPYHEYYQVAPSRMHNFSLVYNTVFSSHLVNQVLAGVNYFKQTFNDFDTSFNAVAAGLNTGVTNPTLSGSPDISIAGIRRDRVDAAARPHRHHGTYR